MSTPTWERRWDTECVLRDLARLTNPDGFPAVTTAALRCTVVLMAALLRFKVQAFPYIYRMPDGGVEVAFDFVGGSVSLWVAPDGSISATTVATGDRNE